MLVHRNIEKVRLWRPIQGIKICAIENRNGILSSTNHYFTVPRSVTRHCTMSRKSVITHSSYNFLLSIVTTHRPHNFSYKCHTRSLQQHKSRNAVYTQCIPVLKNLHTCIGTCPLWTKLRSILCCQCCITVINTHCCTLKERNSAWLNQTQVNVTHAYSEIFRGMW